MKKQEFSKGELTIIGSYADRWNEKFKAFTDGKYVGRTNIEFMLISFLRAVKNRGK